ncbi:MAG TPA: SIMPL domain-containing protein [Bryobacteraceae bacterium]|nr:SIMPL domain-containing protein [Bryobacteraceae bacterium]
MSRLIAIVVFFSPLLAVVQANAQVLPRTVRAVGNATVTAKPDQAQISVSVNTQAATAEDAVSNDASKTEAVLNALKGLIGSKGTIQTTNYSVSPQYKYEQGQPPEITGYDANHTIQLTLNDITLVGKVIDTATKSGANGVNRIEFTVKDDARLQAEAIAKASLEARNNAEAVAKALGMTVSGVFSAETNELHSPRPIITPMAMKMAGPATPVEAGTVDIRASVTVYLSVVSGK